MSVFVLVSGALFKNPELKTSKSGKSYATASIRTASADSAAEFWNLLIFSTSVQEELMRLTEGDKLAVQGALRIELYNNKISRTVFVDAILPLRAPPREKKPRAAKPAPESLDPGNIMPASAAPFDDDIPF